MIPHLRRSRGLAVGSYGFALGRLGSGASSTFAPLGFKLQTLEEGRILGSPIHPKSGFESFRNPLALPVSL